MIGCGGGRMVALVVVVVFGARTLCPSGVLIAFRLLREELLILLLEMSFLVTVVTWSFLSSLFRAACGREVSQVLALASNASIFICSLGLDDLKISYLILNAGKRRRAVVDGRDESISHEFSE
jgi:hypothetical protein